MFLGTPKYRTSLGNLGSTEESTFWSYWTKVKNRINEIYEMPDKLNTMRNNLQAAKVKAIQAGDKDTAKKIDKQVRKVMDDIDIAKKSKEYIDEWMPKWMQMENEASTSKDKASVSGLNLSENSIATNELGFLFLPVWAIASLAGGGIVALTYVATKGLQLIKDYAVHKAILADVEKGVITSKAGSEMMKASQDVSPTFFSTLGEGVGKYIGLALLLGAGIYFAPQILKQFKR